MTQKLPKTLFSILAFALLTACGDRQQEPEVGHEVEWPTGLVTPIEGASFPLVAEHFPGPSGEQDVIPRQGFRFANGFSGRPLADNEPVVAVADGIIARIDREYSNKRAEGMSFWAEQAAAPGFFGKYALDQLRGRQVWIRHEDGHISRYAHLSEVHPELEPGDAVEQGQPVGLMGHSGMVPTDDQIQNVPYLLFELWSPEGERYLGQGLSPLETHQLIAELFGRDSLPRYARQVVRRIEAGEEAPAAYPPEEFPEAGFNAELPGEIIAGNPFAFSITWDGDDFQPDSFFAMLDGEPLGIIDAGNGVWILGAMPLQSVERNIDLVVGAIDPFGQTLVGNRPIASGAPEHQLPPLERSPDTLARYSEENLRIEAETLGPVHAQSLALLEAQWQEPFQPPMQGDIAAVFGQTIFHGVLRPAHPLPGLEIIPDEDISTVRAANSGTVALIEELPIRGKTVAIIHGGGVVTLYANLDEFSVAPGDKVTRGQELGTIRQGENGEVGMLRTEIHVGGIPSNPAAWANQVLPVLK